MTVPHPPFAPPPPSVLSEAGGMSEYRSKLAREVLADIEANRIPAEPLLRKSLRLAIAAGDKEAEEWLMAELTGYPDQLTPSLSTRAIGVRRLVKRRQEAGAPNSAASQGGVTDAPKPVTVFIREALPRIEDEIIPARDESARKAQQAKAHNERRIGLRPPSQVDPTGWHKFLLGQYGSLVELSAVSRSVRNELYRYVTELFHRFAFSEAAVSIFDRHYLAVETAIKRTAPDLLDRLPAFSARLAEGDESAIEQATAIGRRLLQDFADAIFPPQPDPVIDAEGIEHRVTKADYRNRLLAGLKARCDSSSRFDRLKRTIDALYERWSAGMKSRISREEAQSLFVLTLLTLGEIAEIVSSPGVPPAAGPSS
jgi:hypothetical protein